MTRSAAFQPLIVVLSITAVLQAQPPLRAGLTADELRPQAREIRGLVSDAYARHGIRAAISKDTGFNSALNDALPPGGAERLRSLGPYSVVVSNRGPQAIVHLVVRYVTLNSRGNGLVFGSNPVTFADIGSAGGLPPGKSIAVTPVGALTGILFAEKNAPAAAAAPKAMRAALDPQLNQVISDFDRTLRVWEGKGVTILLDSVTLADGSVIGPDLYDVVAEADAKVRAAGEITGRTADAAVPSPELMTWLDGISKSNGSDPSRPDGSMDHHAMIQRALARTLLATLRGESPAGLPNARQKLAASIQEWARPKQALHRVN